MDNYRFFQNTSCEYFPCHKGSDPKAHNCLFCYCPLYALGENCGGGFTYTANGIKDCSACLIPHRKDGYDIVMERMPLLLELAKKPPEKT